MQFQQRTLGPPAYRAGKVERGRKRRPARQNELPQRRQPLRHPVDGPFEVLNVTARYFRNLGWRLCTRSYLGANVKEPILDPRQVVVRH